MLSEIEYHRVLFNTAMLVMACDGDIQDDEISELQSAFQKSAMFKGLDFDSELKRFLAELHQDARKTIGDYFQSLESGDLDPVQKLQVLEIILRIMYADNRVDENEIRLLRTTKEKLGVIDQIFYKRFGEVDALASRSQSDQVKTDSISDIVSGFELPDGLQMRSEVATKQD